MELPYKWMAWSLGRPVSSTNIFVHFMLVSERICRCLFPPKVGRMTQVGCFHWCGSLLRLSHCVGGFTLQITPNPSSSAAPASLSWTNRINSFSGCQPTDQMVVWVGFNQFHVVYRFCELRRCNKITPDLSAVKVFHHTCATRV